MNILLWAMIGTWVSGIGTLSASIIALVLAHKSNNAKIRLKYELHTLDYVRKLRIIIDNIGLTNFTFSDLGLITNSKEVVSLKDFIFENSITPENVSSLRLPFELRREKSKTLYIDRSKLCNVLRNNEKTLSSGFIKMYIESSVGRRYYAKNNLTYKELRDFFCV